MAQWIRIHLPMQQTRVRPSVQEDSSCTTTTEPVLHSKRSHLNEKPKYRSNKEDPPLVATRESPQKSNNYPAEPKKDKHINNKNLKKKILKLGKGLKMVVGTDRSIR